MEEGRSTVPEWLTMAEAISLLDPPHREAPCLIENARPSCSYGLLLLIPAGLMIGATVFVLKFVLPTIVLPRW